MTEPAPHLQTDDQRPWTVIVRDGVVVGRYRAEDVHVTDTPVTCVSLGDGPVAIYEVDARQAPPPNVGEPVGPEVLLRWGQTKAEATAEDGSS